MQRIATGFVYFSLPILVFGLVVQPKRAAATQPEPVVVEVSQEVYDDEPPSTQPEQVSEPVIFPENPNSKSSWTSDEVRERILAYADYYDATERDTELALRIAWAESKYDYDVVNSIGACGIYQIIPSTQRAWNVEDCTNVEENVDAGVSRIVDGQLSHWIDSSCDYRPTYKDCWK